MIAVPAALHGIHKGLETLLSGALRRREFDEFLSEGGMRSRDPGVQLSTARTLGARFANGESHRMAKPSVERCHLAVMTSFVPSDSLLKFRLPNGRRGLLLQDELHRLFDVHSTFL